MENNTRKIKWRLNIFDIIIIAVALVAAFFVYQLSGSGSSIVSSGTQETVSYTIELIMLSDSAYSVNPGDALTDKIERRAIGTVKSAEVKPHTPSVTNTLTGEKYLTEYTDDKKAAVIVVEAAATVTESEISINGFIVRVGTEVSIMGPLYSGSGFIIDIVRGGEA